MTELERYILKQDFIHYYPDNSEKTRHFTLTSKNRSYSLVVDSSTTLDTVWASQKCWFMPGSVVTITDDCGNSKTFIKE